MASRAFDIEGVLTRWEGDQLVERLKLGGGITGDARHNDVWAFGTVLSEEVEVVRLLILDGGEATVIFDIPTPDSFSSAHPTLDGGLYVIEEDGTLVGYDSSGAKAGEIKTEAESAAILDIDPASGKLAAAVGLGNVVFINPETGEVQRLPGIRGVSDVGFARNGELLVITGNDGTVRLWDVERHASAGLVWDGSGVRRSGSSPWYDESTESIWVASSGKLLRVPLNPVRWVERACEIVGRDLTQDEWERFVPGGGEVQSACG